MSRRQLTDSETKFLRFLNLEEETKRLNKELARLKIDIKEEAVKLSDLVQKGIEVKAEAEKIVSDAKIKADEIIAKAKERESGIAKLESELKGKIGNANKREKEAADQLKSNQGKEKNLLAAKETTAGIKAKLTKVLDLIKDVI